MNFSNAAKAEIAQAFAGAIGYSLWVYSGTKPASADTAPTGTLLVQLDMSTQTVNGGVITMPELMGTAVATGTAGYAILSASGMPTGASRIYLTVGTSSAELIMSSLSIVNGDNVTGSATFTVIP